jgi:hypothetical protein
MSKPLASMYELRLTLESSKMDGEDIRSLVGRVSAGYREPDCCSVFERAREKGREVHQVKVTARYEQPGAGEVTTQQLTLEPRVMVLDRKIFLPILFSSIVPFIGGFCPLCLHQLCPMFVVGSTGKN